MTSCPAYGTSYAPVKFDDGSCHAVVYDKEPTPGIYDSIHDIPRAIPPDEESNANPRVVVSTCTDESDTTNNDNTWGSVV